MKGAIFDIDGTLLDSMPIWDQLAERYLKSLGITPEPDLSRTIFHMSLPQGAAYIHDHHPIDQTPGEIEEGVLNCLKDFYYKEVTDKADAISYVRKLQERKIPLAIASTSERPLIEHALKRLGILDCFSHILVCSEHATKKREPAIYHMAAEKLGLLPGQIMVYEDALYAMETARSAGFLVTAVYDEASKDSWEAACRISQAQVRESFKELL